MVKVHGFSLFRLQIQVFVARATCQNRRVPSTKVCSLKYVLGGLTLLVEKRDLSSCFLCFVVSTCLLEALLYAPTQTHSTQPFALSELTHSAESFHLTSLRLDDRLHTSFLSGRTEISGQKGGVPQSDSKRKNSKGLNKDHLLKVHAVYLGPLFGVPNDSLLEVKGCPLTTPKGALAHVIYSKT